MKRGYPPTVAEAASGLQTSAAEIRASFQRLATGRVLVLQRETSEILMANPFSQAEPFLWLVVAPISAVIIAKVVPEKPFVIASLSGVGLGFLSWLAAKIVRPARVAQAG